MGTHRLRDDERASLMSAVLPMLLATLGLVFLAAGALLALVPLLVMGGGLVVVGVAMYFLASALDRADRKNNDRRERARKAAAADFAADRATFAQTARSPLVDEAVAALTGSTQQGGIYPPLRSEAATAPVRDAVAMWEPGATPAPAAFGQTAPGRLVEFEQVDGASPMPIVAGGGTVQWDGGDAEAPHDYRIWPGAKEATGWTSFTGESKARTSRVTDEQIRTAMTARRKDLASRLPTVGAILSHVDERQGDAARRADMTRGRCSQCESVLWAPKQRPIVLKCPGCGHKAKLF